MIGLKVASASTTYLVIELVERPSLNMERWCIVLQTE